MSKRYQVFRDKLPTTNGGFVEAFRIAIVEFACLGERQYDASGYPYSSHHDAFKDDWLALGGDARTAFSKVAELSHDKREVGDVEAEATK